MTEPSTAEAPDYAQQRLGELLDELASDQPAPAGGVGAAITIAVAASLTAMVARRSRRQLSDADVVVGQAEELKRRALSLSGADFVAYGHLLDAMREARSGGRESAGTEPTEAVRTAFGMATDVPLEMAEVAAETCRLAAPLATEGNPSLNGDAVTAVLLAEAGGRAAATLVAINVEQGGLAADRNERASALLDQAAADAARAAQRS